MLKKIVKYLENDIFFLNVKHLFQKKIVKNKRNSPFS